MKTVFQKQIDAIIEGSESYWDKRKKKPKKNKKPLSKSLLVQLTERNENDMKRHKWLCNTIYAIERVDLETREVHNVLPNHFDDEKNLQGRWDKNQPTWVGYGKYDNMNDKYNTIRKIVSFVSVDLHLIN